VGVKIITETFAEDFFLTHSVFIATRDLCEKMMKIYHSGYSLSTEGVSSAAAVEGGQKHDEQRRKKR